MQARRPGRRRVQALLVALGVAVLSLTVSPPVAARTSHAVQLAPVTHTLRRGDQGEQVRELQERLAELRYFVGGVDGQFGYLTEQAVLAFQKVNGLPRTGVAGTRVRAALDDPVRPRPRTSARVALEVVKGRQVVLLAREGHLRRIFNASTGKPSTPTPSGRYRVYREINGWRTSRLGLLYRPKYFYSGYAVHGSLSVPAYAASHGCVRVNVAAADFIWPRVPLGARVRIYGPMKI